MIYKFCPVCGGALKNREIPEEDRARLICEDCAFIFFINPTPAVAVILFNERHEILLVNRKYDPKMGEWSLPTGFLEYDETVRQTAVREVKEETDIDIADVKFRGITSDLFEDSGKHYITLWMEAHYLSGEPKVNAPYEMSTLDWFSWEALPSPLFLSFQNLLDGKTYPPGIR